MFRAVVGEDKIKRIIRFFNAIEKLTDEACFWISEESILFRDLDTARISMIDFELQRDYFTEYEYSGEEKIPVEPGEDDKGQIMRNRSKHINQLIDINTNQSKTIKAMDDKIGKLEEVTVC